MGQGVANKKPRKGIATLAKSRVRLPASFLSQTKSPVRGLQPRMLAALSMRSPITRSQTKSPVRGLQPGHGSGGLPAVVAPVANKKPRKGIATRWPRGGGFLRKSTPQSQTKSPVRGLQLQKTANLKFVKPTTSQTKSPVRGLQPL